MLSRAIRPLLAVAFAVMIALGVTVGTPRPALAGSLVVNVYCGPQSGGGFVCVATPSGSASSLSFAWTAITNATIYNQFDSTDTSVIQGSCSVGKPSSVKVTAKDTAGSSVTVTKSFYCSSTGGLPPLPPLF